MSIQKIDNLPILEIEEVRGEGHYVKLDGRQVARFDGPSAYDDASRCCAVMIQNEITKLERQSIEQPREPLAPHQQYRALLEQISDLRYPDADAALRRKIEASIDKKVTEFLQERGELPKHARAREQQQQIQPPPAMRAQQQRGMDRGGYEQ